MSQIQINRSNVPGEIPDSLLPGQMFFNSADNLLYVGDTTGAPSLLNTDPETIAAQIAAIEAKDTTQTADIAALEDQAGTAAETAATQAEQITALETAQANSAAIDTALTSRLASTIATATAAAATDAALAVAAQAARTLSDANALLVAGQAEQLTALEGAAEAIGEVDAAQAEQLTALETRATTSAETDATLAAQITALASVVTQHRRDDDGTDTAQDELIEAIQEAATAAALIDTAQDTQLAGIEEAAAAAALIDTAQATQLEDIEEAAAAAALIDTAQATKITTLETQAAASVAQDTATAAQIADLALQAGDSAEHNVEHLARLAALEAQPSTTVGIAEPAEPSAGDLWYNAEVQQLMVFTTEWTQANTVPHLATGLQATYPVTTAEFLQHIVYSTTDEAELNQLTTMIEAATTFAEKYTGRLFIAREVSQFFDSFPAASGVSSKMPIILKGGVCETVTAITYMDSRFAEVALPAENYRVLQRNGRTQIFPAMGINWPVNVANEVDMLRVDYSIGTNAPEVPGAIKMAILLIAASLWENRENEIVGNNIKALKPVIAAKDLLHPYKLR